VQTANGIGIQPNILGWIAVFAPLAMVFFLSFRIQKMSFAAAQATFWAYAAIMGISLATILFVYTGASIAMTFFVTAGTFGAMSLWGYTTGRDLTGFGSFLFMGLIGLILASLVGMFFHSSQLQFVISVIGVLIFTGLTAYDSQNIKNMYYVGDDGEIAGKKAVMGALRLYLDFINLFLFLLRFMGSQRR
jgi:FtsH-binding integral membrane protein